MVQGHQGESEESPEDEGVGEAGNWALADDLRLEEDFANKRPDAFRDGRERPAQVFASGEDSAQDGGEAQEEKCGRGGGEDQQQNDFERGEVLGLGERHTGIIPLVSSK